MLKKILYGDHFKTNRTYTENLSEGSGNIYSTVRLKNEIL